MGLSFREQECAKVLSVPPLEVTPCALSVFRGGSWKWQPVVSSRRKDKRWPVFTASHLLPSNNGTAAILPGEHDDLRQSGQGAISG